MEKSERMVYFPARRKGATFVFAFHEQRTDDQRHKADLL